ncbi:bifunctional precorrin-2 dehydrogenase/sirohydrochlorin ferrochelatase [Paenibacillus sp. 1P07SE]|uniref:precorrin-2 dehydrogenase/sirohydrochlorin ferrochelatase family protein n=1 Tax=Paenibacillus sp. 1P07SE TaxID=3132209 RepID=UPI0039A69351
MSRYYPLMVQLEGRLCVVVGGGTVAERKVEGLLAAGASVTVISPAFTDGLTRLAEGGEIIVRKRLYCTGDLRGACLVYAATDNPSVNRLVLGDAEQLGIWVNAADAPEAGSFVTPASVRRGDLLLSVTASGASPLLASRIREELAQRYGPEYEHLTAWLGELRRRVHQLDEPASIRRAMLQRALDMDPSWWQPVQSEDKWQQLLDRLRPL